MAEPIPQQVDKDKSLIKTNSLFKTCSIKNPIKATQVTLFYENPNKIEKKNDDFSFDPEEFQKELQESLVELKTVFDKRKMLKQTSQLFDGDFQYLSKKYIDLKKNIQQHALRNKNDQALAHIQNRKMDEGLKLLQETYLSEDKESLFYLILFKENEYLNSDNLEILIDHYKEFQNGQIDPLINEQLIDLGTKCLLKHYPGKAESFFLLAIENGNTKAMYRLAYYYTHWLSNLEKSSYLEMKAFNLLEQAVFQGHAFAAYEHALLSLKHKKIKRESEEFHNLMLLAENGGHTQASYLLAQNYSQGIGVKKNLGLALNQYLKTIKKLPEQPILEELVSFLKKHSNNKEIVNKLLEEYNISFQWQEGYLACYYEFGIGTSLNKKLAVNLYQNAVNGGDIFALNRVGNICDEIHFGSYELFTQQFGRDPIGFYQKAAEQEDLYALKLFASYYEFDNEAYKILQERRLNRGDIEALIDMCSYEYKESQQFFTQAKESEKIQNADQAKIFSLYKQAADMGSHQAMYAVAHCYRYGLGTDKKLKLAMHFYKQAADNGNDCALFELAHCFLCGGLGVKKNLDSAIALYEKAAAKEHCGALRILGVHYGLGRGVKKDLEKGANLFEEASRMGDVDALCLLADCYRFGKGRIKNAETAFSLYNKAADLGNTKGLRLTGACLLVGQGIAANTSEAIKYYEKAAYLKDEEAILMLGTIYSDGKIIKQNYSKAIDNFRKLINLKSPIGYRALLHLAECYYLGNGIDKDDLQAFSLFQQAAQGGNILAICRLADCYYLGEGTKEDKEFALRLYRQSAEKGCDLAKLRLKLFASN